jgi:hypothetical protein
MNKYAMLVIPVRYREHRNFTSVIMAPWQPFSHSVIKLNVRKQLRIENTRSEYLIYRDSEFLTPRNPAQETIAVGETTIRMSLNKNDVLLSLETRGRGDMLAGVNPPPVPIRDMYKFIRHGRSIAMFDDIGQLTFMADKQQAHQA